MNLYKEIASAVVEILEKHENKQFIVSGANCYYNFNQRHSNELDDTLNKMMGIDPDRFDDTFHLSLDFVVKEK